MLEFWEINSFFLFSNINMNVPPIIIAVCQDIDVSLINLQDFKKAGFSIIMMPCIDNTILEYDVEGEEPNPIKTLCNKATELELELVFGIRVDRTNLVTDKFEKLYTKTLKKNNKKIDLVQLEIETVEEYSFRIIQKMIMDYGVYSFYYHNITKLKEYVGTAILNNYQELESIVSKIRLYEQDMFQNNIHHHSIWTAENRILCSILSETDVPQIIKSFSNNRGFEIFSTKMMYNDKITDYILINNHNNVIENGEYVFTDYILNKSAHKVFLEKEIIKEIPLINVPDGEYDFVKDSLQQITVVGQKITDSFLCPKGEISVMYYVGEPKLH